MLDLHATGRQDLRMSPMEIALLQAHAAGARGEVPVGAVVVTAAGTVLSQAGNETEARADPSARCRTPGVAGGGGRAWSAAATGLRPRGNLRAMSDVRPGGEFLPHPGGWCSAPTIRRVVAWNTGRECSMRHRATTGRRWWAG